MPVNYAGHTSNLVDRQVAIENDIKLSLSLDL
jgi:hypothetical protein